jgi:hypothetical protein
MSSPILLRGKLLDGGDPLTRQACVRVFDLKCNEMKASAMSISLAVGWCVRIASAMQ